MANLMLPEPWPVNPVYRYQPQGPALTPSVRSPVQLYGFQNCSGRVPPQPFQGNYTYQETWPVQPPNIPSDVKFLINDPVRNMYVYAYENFFSNEEANELWNTIIREVPLNKAQGQIYGRTITYPRKIAFMSDIPVNMKKLSGYPNLIPWHPKIKELQQRMQQLIGNDMNINSALINYYQDPTDKIGWHSDREVSPPHNMVVAITLSPYFPRRILYRERKKYITGSKAQNWTFYPKHGSVYIMRGDVNGKNGKLDHSSPGLTKTEQKAFNYDPCFMQRISITWRDLVSYQ